MPGRRTGRQMGVPKIMILVAGAALYRGHAESGRTAANIHGMAMTVVALARIVALGMAVHAARVAQNGDESNKKRSIVVGGRIRVRRVRRLRCNHGTRKPYGSGEYR